MKIGIENEISSDRYRRLALVTRLGGLPFHPGIHVGSGEGVDARGRNPREGHGAEHGVRSVSERGDGGGEARIGERGPGRVRLWSGRRARARARP